MNSAVDHYAVFGNPIAHSKSPAIHRQFAEQTTQSLIYSAELVELDEFVPRVRLFAKQQGKGLNITVPFKQQAWELADNRSARAEHAGAVNTLILNKDGSITGDNTDGIGLVNDLIKNHNISLTDKNILIIGAGGAVRGVIEPILFENPAKLLIANRTSQKAVQLANDFSSLGNIQGCGLETLEEKAEKQRFDIIINGTSASLQGELPALPDKLFNINACAYDMMYAAQATVFMEWARQQGANHVFDGLGMLVEQAAESFWLWRHVRPDTATVITSLRNSMD